MLFEELQSLMIKYRFRANKKLAQHFIINKAVIEKLVETAMLEKRDVVLEIGAGTGFLTRKLAKKSKVVAFELDEKLCTLLENELPEKAELFCQDFLKAKLPVFSKVVALPPYSHSAEIMYKLLENDFELAALVFQREFAEKLSAFPGFAQYSALSVITQASFEASVIERVLPGAFFPKPKDESCIVLLKKRKNSQLAGDKKLFALFVKTVFRFRNKNVKNALSKGKQFLLTPLGLDSKQFDERVQGLKLLDEKVDLIPVDSFVEMFSGVMKASR